MMSALMVRVARPEELPRVIALRHEVFVLEQGVSVAEEQDGRDAEARHYLALVGGEVIGCARLLSDAGDAHIGRLAVKKAWRSRGVGGTICRFVMEDCARQGLSPLWLHAQLHAREFYEKLGFRPEGEVFTEAGIAHIKMVL